MKKFLISENKLKEIKQELKNLKEVKKPEIIERIKVAISFGDLSENDEYQSAKEKQGFLEGKIRELEEMIKYAAIVLKKKHLSHVRIGKVVVIENIETGEQKKFEIVGVGEFDPLKGKISYISPLGVLLFKKQEGDFIELDARAGKQKYKIIEIK